VLNITRNWLLLEAGSPGIWTIFYWLRALMTTST